MVIFNKESAEYEITKLLSRIDFGKLILLSEIFTIFYYVFP